MEVEKAIEEFLVEDIMLADADTRLDFDESLLDSGILDSLSLLRLIGFLEDHFGVLVGDDEVLPENFQSINLTAMFVRSKMNGS